MSKSQKLSKSEDIYPIQTDVLEAFLSENGFLATTFEIDTKYNVWKRDDVVVRITRDKVFTKTQTEEILAMADLAIEDFERYIERIKLDGFFDKLVDWSLKTPPLKHLKKGGDDSVK